MEYKRTKLFSAVIIAVIIILLLTLFPPFFELEVEEKNYSAFSTKIPVELTESRTNELNPKITYHGSQFFPEYGQIDISIEYNQAPFASPVSYNTALRSLRLSYPERTFVNSISPDEGEMIVNGERSPYINSTNGILTDFLIKIPCYRRLYTVYVVGNPDFFVYGDIVNKVLSDFTCNSSG